MNMDSKDPKMTMDVFAKVKALVVEHVLEIASGSGQPDDVNVSSITLERPKNRSHGELSTNAAMLLAKSVRRKPVDVAGELAARLERDKRIAGATVAGPGFVNLTLVKNVWMEVLGDVLQSGNCYGRPEVDQRRRINVEFVSANPTGPLHVGNARGAVFGDALGRLLEFAGHDVTREYYINDGGAQADTLARSAHLRYLEANGESVEFDGQSYKGKYLIPVGTKLKEKFGRSMIGRPESDWLEEFRNIAVKEMMEFIRNDLAMLGVRMDVYFSERSLYGTGKIENSINALDEKGLIYEGVLEPPKGQESSHWKPRIQQLFKSTALGDDRDRPIMKPDGSWTYFAPDIAYHHDKLLRGFDELINVFGSDHGGYCSRIKAVVLALSDGGMPFDIKTTQLVNVVSKDGPMRMSKRLGNFVQLSEAVEAVGPDVTRFVMLMRRNDAPLDFDFEKVREQSRDNPVFYVQYAHARVCSVLEKAEQAGFDTSDPVLAGADLTLLNHPAQLGFVRRIAEWPRVVKAAARSHEPHRIAFYLYELASEFHALWTKGMEAPELHFLQESDKEGTQARIALARSASLVISSGLGIVGVEPMTRM